MKSFSPTNQHSMFWVLAEVYDCISKIWRSSYGASGVGILKGMSHLYQDNRLWLLYICHLITLSSLKSPDLNRTEKTITLPAALSWKSVYQRTEEKFQWISAAVWFLWSHVDWEVCSELRVDIWSTDVLLFCSLEEIWVAMFHWTNFFLFLFGHKLSGSFYWCSKMARSMTEQQPCRSDQNWVPARNLHMTVSGNITLTLDYWMWCRLNKGR